ncbi:MAG: PilZ domain-containing protein [Rhodobiaceae bacterium]|nr:PilZ domain-containing protein [Rhodobiaceae bacterium]MCC0059723.1 PilZ domain-containing protein [Rhodobiaceae bacterium]
MALKNSAAEITKTISITERFSGYDAPQLAVLGKVRDKIASAIGPILDRFYESVACDQVVGEILEQGPGVETLKTAQRDHWEALFAGQISDDIRKRGKRIGDAHVRVGLMPGEYVASYSFLVEALVEQFMSDRKTTTTEITTLLRALFIDMAVALSAFQDISADATRKTEARMLADTVSQEMDHIKREVSKQAEELTIVVDTMSQAMSDLTSGVSLVEAGTASVAEGIDRVSSRSEDILTSSVEVGRNAASTAERVQQALVRTEEAQESISMLLQETDRIRTTVELIEAIARQTNLLALNATIEAARAGAAGKGFAVVAAEVKSLSSNTAEATAEISRVVQGINEATQRVTQSMTMVGEEVRSIDQLAENVHRSSGEQEASISEVAESAQAAKGGADDLRRSVEIIDGGTKRASASTTEVHDHTQKMVNLVHQLEQRLAVTLKSFKSLDQRFERRLPERIDAKLVRGSDSCDLRTIDLSSGGCLLPDPGFKLKSGEAVVLTLAGTSPVGCRVSGDHPFGIRLQFVDKGSEDNLKQLLEDVEGRQDAINDMVRSTAAAVSERLNSALSNATITPDALFDINYQQIPGSNPAQFRTCGLDVLKTLLPGILDPVLGNSHEIAYCIATDRNGWAPVHNPDYSKPQGPDPEWNTRNSRNMRIFDDRTGLSAARNIEEVLAQTYKRDLGDGTFVLMRDYSSPVHVDGKHWGAVRIGIKFD